MRGWFMKTELGPWLVAWARYVLDAALGLRPETLPPPESEPLTAPGSLGPLPEAALQPGASFVTLRGRDGRLRGCIGSLTARQALWRDVAENTRSAAFSDPRFSPVRPPEAPSLRLSVSVLTPPVERVFSDAAGLLSALSAEHPGLTLRLGPHRATFLPQVWQELPLPETFLSALCAKAGLPPLSWQNTGTPQGPAWEFYQAREFGETFS